jgi:hypothetical protein
MKNLKFLYNHEKFTSKQDTFKGSFTLHYPIDDKWPYAYIEIPNEWVSVFTSHFSTVLIPLDSNDDWYDSLKMKAKGLGRSFLRTTKREN